MSGIRTVVCAIDIVHATAHAATQYPQHLRRTLVPSIMIGQYDDFETADAAIADLLSAGVERGPIEQALRGQG